MCAAFDPSFSATSSPTPAPGTAPDQGAALAPVTVMFSGGSDSTLTASLLWEKHSHVHLITYRHAAMQFEDKCLRSYERLQRAHGPERFSHQFINLNALMKQLFVKPIVRDLKTYGTYALPMCCGAC